MRPNVGSVLEAPREDFSAEWFAAYLSRRFGKPATVSRFERFTRGTSRQTWFVQFQCAGEAVREVALRTDHPGGSGDPTTLDQEHYIYTCLQRTKIPVARVLWWESDPAETPRPFYIRELVDGSWNIPDFSNPSPDYNFLRVQIGKEHMRKLAIVHSADWRAAGFGERLGYPQGVDDAARRHIDDLLARLRAFGAEPQPILLEVREFLLDRAPPAPRISLCKGTNGYGEEVFKNGEIVAMSDWEEVVIGDPASDLALVQSFTEPVIENGKTLWDIETALSYYRDVSGINVSMENVRYYQMVRLLGRAVMFAHTSCVVKGNPLATARQSWTATEVQHVMKAMLASAIGLGAPVSSKWLEEMNETVESAS